MLLAPEVYIESCIERYAFDATVPLEEIRSALVGVERDASRLAYKLALGRPATQGERDRAIGYVNSYLRDPALGRVRDVDEVKLKAWSSLCQALMASAEFRYLN